MYDRENKMIAAGAITVVLVILCLLCYAAFWSTHLHDWDCSKHGGLKPVPFSSLTYCEDGYRP